MGTCVICGVSVDGEVCESHEEDVCFDFLGTKAAQLTPGRFYRGTVDGFADFGVFIDIGDRVTGLLHQSELDRRLESLDWEPGDEVYVQVKHVRDNGNVDLGWSIRQHATEFRGSLVDDPEGRQDADAQSSSPESPAGEDNESQEIEKPQEAAGVQQIRGGSEVAAESSRQRTPIEALADHVGDPVRIEGTIVEIRQTSGPTVFEIRDETGSIDCAAFESAGVRAYPEVEAGDVVRIDGIVEEHRGDLQLETDALDRLEEDESDAVRTRLDEAIADRATPTTTDLLADHPEVESVRDELVAVATAIRRAIFEARPVVVRHNATADGYLGGAALERASLDLIVEEHDERDALYHYFDRRPLDGRVYGMGDAMRDVTAMLDAAERHGEPAPLFVFVNAGATDESRDGFELLDLYNADRIVIDASSPDNEMADAALVFVGPGASPNGNVERISTTALCANAAVMLNPAVHDDLRHLPAVSYWRDTPSVYVDLAASAGYDEEDTTALREAIAFEAFFQAYEDKRELVTDLLFERRDLAQHASHQFRERVAEEVRTAQPHLEHREEGAVTIGVLDLEAFTHTYDFPPPDLLLAELASHEETIDALLGIGEDRLRVWSEAPLDMRQTGEEVASTVPRGGVETRGGRDGSLVFLAGHRTDVIEAAVTAVADQLTEP